MKKFSIIILFLMFLLFLFYQMQKNINFQVLKVVSPSQIIIDLNNNGVEDENETIFLNDIQSFSTKPNKEQSNLALKLKISEIDALGLGFLAESTAKEILEGQKVEIINSDIVINDKNYKNLLLNKGLAFRKNNALNLKSTDFQQNLEKVRKLKLVIFNNKSHKYHLLNCKYGLMAHNSQILPVNQISKDAKPCKFCHNKYKKHHKYKKSNKKFKYYDDEIPDIKSPATVFQKNLSTGCIKIFLTDLTKVLKPSNSCNTAICEALVNEINSAQKSIDYAIYGYTKILPIQNALAKAQKRGVEIRFVYDLDNGKNLYPDTLYLADIFSENQHDLTPQLMHDKFFIFDKKTVLTGSANISNTDMSGFNSNAIIIVNSEKIANLYTQEFEQMYKGNFHKQKKRIHDKNQNDFEIYFSPKDKGITAIIDLVDKAQKYVYIPAFLITHKELANSLVNAANRGVSIKIILDATNTHTGSSKMKFLRQNGIQVKTENFAGKLHSKSVVIDDLYTVIGSMNFSRSGENVNDENLVIIKDKDIAIFYKTFFQYLWKRIPDKWLKYNARAESPDSIGSCNDGIDNDFDGKIDKADDSCILISNKKKRK